ncbi:DUF4249 domain-containing protein [Pedobacter heparinus]|uniref:DUF4249 domain-containing protein n=1 Tax=Pedobacter heparinus (strain ATCC 13125 / DSM 2366 / CIP 104194 / JCM 7457 / NBRC 12017 / NCIMB 9290 / NRRL B-14731 / HIM 762-3) TaxID=485917 RepID=C6XU92_PEDHD|nr:DUF4249 domain-containing protein [Pedobacter heparinus]ACU05885.1 hypothetical protein Phep_3694 [Pedobacter heparinus DSM 2366]
MFWSCEKAIDLKLKDSDITKYVIEGAVTNQSNGCKVIISETKKFSDDNQFNGISGAIVKIENNGSTFMLTETGKGIYENLTVTGVPGQTYRLTVTIKGEVFKASSTMPAVVDFLDFTLKPNDVDTIRATPRVKFKDPLATRNYYWFQQYINDKLLMEYKVLNDEYTSGQEVNEYLVYENTTKNRALNLKKGDRLTAEMHCIDEPVFTYLFSLFGANGADNGAAPTNPLSNISGGALGFFSAHTVQLKTIVIP